MATTTEYPITLTCTEDELRALEHLGTMLGMSVENVIRTACYHELGRQDLNPHPDLFRRRPTATKGKRR